MLETEWVEYLQKWHARSFLIPLFVGANNSLIICLILNSHNYNIMKKTMDFAWLLFLFIFISSSQAYNTSLCTDIEIGDLHYYINANSNNQNIFIPGNGSSTIYNLCKQVEVYCSYLNAVINASMVVVSTAKKTCTPFTQSQVALIDAKNVSSGIVVTYSSLQNQSIAITTPCFGSGIGCPNVQQGILWEYFQKGLLTYTIIIEVVGIILMVLGIYIYRGSIVLIGWGTATLILLMIESFFVFLKGVPDSLIQNVIVITLICSFFVGYILGYFPKAGVFCMGLWIGGVIALTLNNIAFYYVKSNPPNLVIYIVAPVLCVSFGVIILFIRRAFITFASSLIGSYLCLRALSWYLGAFPNEFELSKKYHLGLSGAVPWQFYLYVIALLILTASSSALQTWLFKKKMSRVHETGDIEQHLDKMESSLRKERDGLIEFKNVFQNESKKPRVLNKYNVKRSHDTSIKEEQSESEKSQQNEAQSLPDYEESQNEPPKKEQLREGLLKGKKRNR